MEKLQHCQEKALKLGLAIAVGNLNYVSFPVRQGASEGQNTIYPRKNNLVSRFVRPEVKQLEDISFELSGAGFGSDTLPEFRS